MSRALTILITLKRMVKLTDTRLIRPSGLVISRYLGPLQSHKIQAMSTVTDEELNDPKRHLDYKEFIEIKDKENVVVIDVRDHSEIKETGKIPGSIHIPLNDLTCALKMSDEEFLILYNSAKPKLCGEIIFSCRSGRRSFTAMKIALEAGYKVGGRSIKALKLALELGFENAKNFKGGWLDWAKNT